MIHIVDESRVPAECKKVKDGHSARVCARTESEGKLQK